MTALEQATAKFVQVRDTLLQECKGDMCGEAARAYRISFSVPMMFYRDRTVSQAIAALRIMAKEEPREPKYITIDNAPELLGKSVDSVKRMFHYYPLRIGQWSSGRYYYADRHGVAIPIEKGDKIPYDFIVENAGE